MFLSGLLVAKIKYKRAIAMIKTFGKLRNPIFGEIFIEKISS